MHLSAIVAIDHNDLEVVLDRLLGPEEPKPPSPTNPIRNSVIRNANSTIKNLFSYWNAASATSDFAHSDIPAGLFVTGTRRRGPKE